MINLFLHNFEKYITNILIYFSMIKVRQQQQEQQQQQQEQQEQQQEQQSRS